MADPDPLAATLSKADIAVPLKAQVWDLYQQSKNEDDFAAKVQGLDIPKTLKADLWDLKSKDTQRATVPTGPPGTPPPSGWTTQYPRTAALVKGAVDTLPAIGAITGGILSTPETFGTGTVAGAALGAGVGRGARDLIAEGIGLEPKSTPLAKAGTIALDTATTAAVPGAIEAAKTPIQSIAEFANTYRKFIPRALQPQFLEDLPQLIEKMRVPAQPGPILTRPAGMVTALGDPAEIAALKSKLASPMLANNPQARGAVIAALKARGVDMIGPTVDPAELLLKSPSFSGLPSSADVLKYVNERNLQGNWK